MISSASTTPNEKKVGTAVGVFEPELLRSEVPHLPLEDAGRGARLPSPGFGDAEVGDPDHPVEAHQDVLWADIPVNKMQKGPVGCPELMDRVESQRDLMRRCPGSPESGSGHRSPSPKR